MNPGTIGRYRVEALLGRGAMGEVWRAVDPAIDRRVAIKAVRLDSPLFEGTPDELLARFRQEARSAGRLKHPNVVAIHDYGEDEGLYYLVLEYVEGTTLAERVASEGALPPEEACAAILQACSALAAAHREGIVHRDIKPANLMVERKTGLLKVLDFGIARLEAVEMTRTGTVYGTPSYMSPEQVLGRRVDHRTDLFSLGAVFHELVTGRKAFPGDHLATIAYRIVNEEPAGFPGLPERLGDGYAWVVGRALAKDPDERFQTAEEMAEAVRTFALDAAAPPRVKRTPPIVAQPVAAPVRAPGRRMNRRAVALGAALALALLASGAGIWAYLGGEAGRAGRRAGGGAGSAGGAAERTVLEWPADPDLATEATDAVPGDDPPDPDVDAPADLPPVGPPGDLGDVQVILDDRGSEAIIDLDALYEELAATVEEDRPVRTGRSGSALARFDRSPGRRIPNNNRLNLFRVPLEECARACLERDGGDGGWTCRSFQFTRTNPNSPSGGSLCELGEKSRATHPPSSRPGFDHFERTLR